MKSGRRIALKTVLAVAAASCGSEATGNASLVQIASYRISPGTITCGGATASPDTAILQVEMVNTTTSDVTVASVGSYGTVIRTSTGNLVGTTAVVFNALPYVPQAALVAARTGDVTVRVSLPTSSLCSPNLPSSGYKDVQTTARVTTNSGQYTTVGAILHVFFQ